MPKFYVQTGNFRTTINAGDAEKAALWVIHKVMEQVMPFFSEDLDHVSDNLAQRPNDLMILGERILVSEQGFDNPNQLEFDAFELQTHWQQLSVALYRLESMVLKSCESTEAEVLCELA